MKIICILVLFSSCCFCAEPQPIQKMIFDNMHLLENFSDNKLDSSLEQIKSNQNTLNDLDKKNPLFDDLCTAHIFLSLNTFNITAKQKNQNTNKIVKDALFETINRIRNIHDLSFEPDGKVAQYLFDYFNYPKVKTFYGVNNSLTKEQIPSLEQLSLMYLLKFQLNYYLTNDKKELFKTSYLKWKNTPLTKEHCAKYETHLIDKIGIEKALNLNCFDEYDDITTKVINTISNMNINREEFEYLNNFLEKDLADKFDIINEAKFPLSFYNSLNMLLNTNNKDIISCWMVFMMTKPSTVFNRISLSNYKTKIKKIYDQHINKPYMPDDNNAFFTTLIYIFWGTYYGDSGKEFYSDPNCSPSNIHTVGHKVNYFHKKISQKDYKKDKISIPKISKTLSGKDIIEIY